MIEPYHSLESAYDHASSPSIMVADVDISDQLACRPYRSANYEVENRALLRLAQEMSDHPANILQRLVEVALDLCGAGTAGLSLLESNHGEALFRWAAVAGAYTAYRNQTMPRYASPCGATIERKATLLISLPERAFPALRADPPAVEALLVPFYFEGKPIGTVWVVAHDQDRQFDMEDQRIVMSLAQFAAAGWQLWTVRARLEAAQTDLREKVEDLERFSDIVVGRELHMMELEREITALKAELTAVREKGNTG